MAEQADFELKMGGIAETCQFFFQPLGNLILSSKSAAEHRPELLHNAGVATQSATHKTAERERQSRVTIGRAPMSHRCRA
jgi:hypothetical protein